MNKSEYLKYTDLDKAIKSNKLQYLILLGQRSNGKSYAAKELSLRRAWEKDEQFTYLRRRKEHIQDYMVMEYFGDMIVPNKAGNTKISEITKGEYSTLSILKKVIYFANPDEEGKMIRGPQAGFIHALSGAEEIKSRQFPKVRRVIFEEFIATGLYLYDEPTQLQNYTSTIFRNQTGCVIMIGNTISRIVPYFNEWQLDQVPRQKQGTIDVYTFTTDQTETRIGVFLCESLKTNSGMFFGSAAKMIVGGEWERSEQPKLEHPREEYDTLYRMVFKYTDTAVYLMSFIWLRSDHSVRLWYVEPKTTPIKEGTRVVSPAMNEGMLYTQSFKPLTPKESTVFLYFEMGKIAYSDNLTGTEFKRCVEQMRKR